VSLQTGLDTVPARATPSRWSRVRRRRRATEPSVLFALPALAVYLLIVVYPSLAGAVYAFTDWKGLAGVPVEFVGLDNFRQIFTDDQSFSALKNTLYLTAFIAIVQNGIGLLLALGVHTAIKSRNLLRVILFAPAVISPVVIAFLWKYLFNPEPDSGINAVLGFVGLGGLQQDWLGNEEIALWAVGMTVVWQYAGYSMVIFLAGLQNVPRELLEAAEVDGAGRWRRFRHITFPLLAPALTINLMLSTIGGLKLFDQVFAITGGGPGYATETLSTLIYKQAFVFGSFGYSTALALVLAIIVAAISLVQLQVLRGREVAG
jgi:raffinose/stachyose/melibiose transport system permease protein